jgi:hypothetical protein
MKNEIQVMHVNDILCIAKTFAESGMFADAKAMAQAFVKIQAGQEIGIPPFAAMSGIHIIQGKPTIGAGLIASTVKGSGKYDYRVKEMNEKICSIDFLQGKDFIGNSTFTIEDAKKALTKNIDKFPKNMLFARAISNGVKWFCPDVFSGPVYVPEEMQEVTEDVVHVEIVNTVSTEKDKASIPAKAIVQPPTKEWATTENLKNAKSKGFTIEDVKKKYKVRVEQETEFSTL